MLTDGAALNRWRLVLGKNAGQQISLAGSRLLRLANELARLLDALFPAGSRRRRWDTAPLRGA